MITNIVISSESFAFIDQFRIQFFIYIHVSPYFFFVLPYFLKSKKRIIKKTGSARAKLYSKIYIYIKKTIGNIKDFLISISIFKTFKRCSRNANQNMTLDKD